MGALRAAFGGFAGGVAAIIALGVLAFPAVVNAEERAGRIFFAVGVGTGLAWPDDPQFEPGPTSGLVWDVTYGWELTPHWAVGVDFGTWQNSWLGLPFHFHTGFDPRIEWTPGGGDGVVLGLAAGLGATDGVRPPGTTRHGAAVSARAAYRVDLGRGLAATIVGGTHTHFYGKGTAVIPFLVAELRVYGDLDAQ
jgi:hypothetical protein